MGRVLFSVIVTALVAVLVPIVWPHDELAPPVQAAGSFTVTPTSGGAGTSVTVHGSGLKPSTSVDVSLVCTWPTGGGVNDFLGNVLVGADGTANYSSGPLPGDLQTQVGPPPCPYAIHVHGVSADGSIADLQQPFTFTGSLPTATPTLAPVPTATTMSLICAGQAPSFPGILSPGQSATFFASGFKPGSPVTVTVSGPSPSQSLSLTADSGCQVHQTLEVAATDRPGTYTITAIGQNPAGGLQSASLSYTVPVSVSASSPPPPPPPSNPPPNPLASAGSSAPVNAGVNPPVRPPAVNPPVSQGAPPSLPATSAQNDVDASTAPSSTSADANPPSTSGQTTVDGGGLAAIGVGSNPPPVVEQPPFDLAALVGGLVVTPTLSGSPDEIDNLISDEDIQWMVDVASYVASRGGVDTADPDFRQNYVVPLSQCLTVGLLNGLTQVQAGAQCLSLTPPTSRFGITSWAGDIDSMVATVGGRLVQAAEQQQTEVDQGTRAEVTITPTVIFEATEAYRACLAGQAVKRAGEDEVSPGYVQSLCLQEIELYYTEGQ